MAAAAAQMQQMAAYQAMMQQAAAAQQAQAAAMQQQGGQPAAAAGQQQMTPQQQQMAAYQQAMMQQAAAAQQQQAQQQQAQMGGAQAAQAAAAAQAAQAAQHQQAQMRAQQAAMAQAQAQGQGQPGAAQPAGQFDQTLIVTGCVHATVGPIIRGTFVLSGENHGKPVYKKSEQVNGLDVLTYFWDQRDGDGFSGWWFGPKVGGDQVWAYHADKTSAGLPPSGWKVPYDGPVDTTMSITPKPGQQGQMPQAPQQGQPQQAQQGWTQQQQLAWAQQQHQAAQAAAAGKGGQQPGGQQDQMRLQQQRQQLDALKSRQQQEQQKRLEENRKKLEEANKSRMAQQAEFAIKQKEEVEKRQALIVQQRAEQEAILKIRRVQQKFRMTSVEKHEELKAEFEEIVKAEIENCGSYKEKIEQECVEATAAAAKRVVELEENAKLEAERKVVEMARRKELRAKAESLLVELSKLLDDAEAASKSLTEEAEPFSGDKDMKADAINACAGAVEKAVVESNSKMQIVNDFMMKESQAMRDTPPIEGEEPATCQEDLTKCSQRAMEVKKVIAATAAKAITQKTTRLKKALALEEVNKHMVVFKKYAKDSKEKLTRKEIMAYAKGEFSFVMPASTLDQIFNAMAEEGAKGIPKDDFYRVRSAVGLAREVAADATRREEREKREKELVKKKESLQEKVDKAKAEVESTEGDIKKVEDKIIPAEIEKSATMEATELATLVEEIDSVISAAKDSVQGAKDKIASLTDGVEAELKAFIDIEVRKLDGLIKNSEAKIAKLNVGACKIRCNSVKKAGGKLFKVLKDTIVTQGFSLNDDKDETRKLKDATRKLKAGEMVEEKEAVAKEEVTGLMRMKVRAITDGQIGWATMVGNTGIVFLEAEEKPAKKEEPKVEEAKAEEPKVEEAEVEESKPEA